MPHYITNTDLINRIEAQCDITVATLAERDALLSWRRKWKMIVGVYDDGINNGFYALNYNKTSTNLADNGNWHQLPDDITQSFSFDIADWLVMGGGYYIEFVHSKGDDYSVEIRDSGNKIVSVSDMICSDNLVRIQVPNDFRFEGKLIINI